MSDLFRSGRGGAGNFHTKSAVDALQKSEDLEAQNSSSSTSINDLTRSISASQAPPEYVHTGRGGAGNWVQPKELHSKGMTQESTEHGQDATQRALPNSKPLYKGGRGGAGNYGDYYEEERLKKEAEEKKRLDVEKAVQQDVESGLARPERSYGGPAGSWETQDVKGQDRQ